MATFSVSAKDLGKLLEKHAADRVRRVRAAMGQTAVHGAHLVAQNVPIAFGELRSSVHAEVLPEHTRTVVNAPYAAAVEGGSRPHWVPIEPLLKWVKLRGMQGLSAKGNARASKGPGTTTARHSLGVASQLANMMNVDSGGAVAAGFKARKRSLKMTGREGALAQRMADHASERAASRALKKGVNVDIDAPMQIARSIQFAIGIGGTKPHWFVRQQLPAIESQLKQLVKASLPEQ